MHTYIDRQADRQTDRHDINKLRPSRPNKSNNLIKEELLALKSLRSWEDIVIKPDKGAAIVVWKADLYRQKTLRQLNDTTFYARLDSDPTFIPPKNRKSLY